MKLGLMKNSRYQSLDKIAKKLQSNSVKLHEN